MKEEDLEAIGAYVKTHMKDWMKEAKIIPFSGDATALPDQHERDFSFTERIVRVEEGIKHQGDLLEKMLGHMDKRFEQVDKRFEQVDKRFEELRMDMNTRFKNLFIFLSTIFVILGTLMSVYEFIA